MFDFDLCTVAEPFIKNIIQVEFEKLAKASLNPVLSGQTTKIKAMVLDKLRGIQISGKFIGIVCAMLGCDVSGKKTLAKYLWDLMRFIGYVLLALGGFLVLLYFI